MAATPLLEETSGTASAPLIRSFAGASQDAVLPAAMAGLREGRPERKLAIYPANAGFDLVDELDYLSARAIEPNIFFNPRFLAPAMPRLEDRDVKLAVIRDGNETRSRLRLLAPFSIERPSMPLAVPVTRIWTSPFSPLGTPLVDCDDPGGVIEDFLEMMGRSHLKMPRVVVFPTVRLDGPFASLIGAIAESRGLPMTIADKVERPALRSSLEGEAYLRGSLSGHHFREMKRMRRRLGERGTLGHHVARGPEEVREGIEAFLALEASGWKGRARSAMAVDRYRAAFVREAAYRLADRDLCRVHTLTLNDRPIASLVVFLENGMGYTWKTAYDEELAAFSPGMLLMLDVTMAHLEDPNISQTDSCAVPDHPVLSRLWQERLPVGTILIGLSPDTDRQVRLAASQLQFHRQTLDFARRVRSRVRRLLKRD